MIPVQRPDGFETQAFKMPAVDIVIPALAADTAKLHIAASVRKDIPALQTSSPLFLLIVHRPFLWQAGNCPPLKLSFHIRGLLPDLYLPVLWPEALPREQRRLLRDRPGNQPGAKANMAFINEI